MAIARWNFRRAIAIPGDDYRGGVDLVAPVSSLPLS